MCGKDEETVMPGKENGKEKSWKILEVKEGFDELFDLGIV